MLVYPPIVTARLGSSSRYPDRSKLCFALKNVSNMCFHLGSGTQCELSLVNPTTTGELQGFYCQIYLNEPANLLIIG